MKIARQSVYLDSTIPSAYFDSRTPERQGQTLQFWHERLPDFEVVISSVVLLEIRATPDEERRWQLENLVKDCKVLVFDEEADALAQEYVGREVFPQKYVDDGNHVAVAVTNGIGYFCSWNFTHLVNVNIRREVNLINALKGDCSVPEIDCLNSADESPVSQGARAQATCVRSASEGNAARRDESVGEWRDISGTGHLGPLEIIAPPEL